MRTRDIQWGILGAGKIAGVFAAGLAAAGLRVSAVAARDGARAESFARTAGVPRSHGSFHLPGAPHATTVTGSATPAGVDTGASIVMRHGGGAVSTTVTGMVTPGPNTAAVIGTQGWLELDPCGFASTGFTLHDAGRPGRAVRRCAPPSRTGRGLHFQALEVERCLRGGALGSPLMPLHGSVAVMKALDEIRSRILSPASASASASAPPTARDFAPAPAAVLLAEQR